MTPMEITDDEFAKASRQWAQAMLAMLDRLPVDGEQATNLLTAAFSEVLAQRLGGIPQAIERVRLIADVWEKQALGDLGRID